jgi:hypothetical protein
VSRPPSFLPLAIAAAGFILLQQGFDLAGVLPGSDLGTPAGRIRQLIAMEAKTPALIAADALALWALFRLGARTSLRWAGFVHLAAGAIALLLVPVFLVDAGRVASGFAGPEAFAFRLVVVRTLAVGTLLGAALVLAGRELTGPSRWSSEEM